MEPKKVWVITSAVYDGEEITIETWLSNTEEDARTRWGEAYTDVCFAVEDMGYDDSDEWDVECDEENMDWSLELNFADFKARVVAEVKDYYE